MFRTLPLLLKNAMSKSSPLVLETVTKAHRKDLLEFLGKYFLNEESLTRASKMDAETWEPCAEQIVDRCSEYPISFLYRDTRTNEIASVGLSSIWTKPDPNAPKELDFEFGTEGADERQVAVQEIVNKLHDQFFKLKPEFDKVLHFELVAVKPEHKRKGHYMDYLKIKEDIVKDHKYGIQAMAAETTSIGTQLGAEKMNYNFVTEEKLSDYKDKDGKQLLVCDDGMETVKLFYTTCEEKKKE